MTTYQQVVAAWNAQADEHNQWDSLGEDEKIEWALKCADQFRGATKMMAQEAVACMTKIIDYTNWRGERRERKIVPQYIVFGSTEYHPDPQWLLVAHDIEKGARRTFAMDRIHSWCNTEAQPNAPQSPAA